jgi:glycosyltransferase involved in cell wall biosynthesis
MSEGTITSLSWLLKYTPRSASSRVRGSDLARALEARGVHGHLAHPGQAAWKARYLGIGLTAPALVFQKRSSRNDVRLLRARRALAEVSFFDLDDAPSGVEGHERDAAGVRRMMQLASGVVVGSEALEAFAAEHTQWVCRIPSTIDVARFAPGPERIAAAGQGITIGWMGNGAGYWRDLTRLAPLLHSIVETDGARVVLAGAMAVPEIHRAFAWPGVTILDELDWTDDARVRDVLAAFDIGLYPLEDSPYNRFKCGFKAVQYMALGLPVVASPVGETRIVVEQGGTGFLPASEADWHEALVRLVRNPDLRRTMGRRGRARAEAHYGLDVAADRWLAFLEQVSSRRVVPGRRARA